MASGPLCLGKSAETVCDYLTVWQTHGKGCPAYERIASGDRASFCTAQSLGDFARYSGEGGKG